MNKKDSLFDGQWTWLDTVKVALLIVTMFSTWYVIDLVTPPVSLAFVRELAAVIFVEGAFLAFEKATSGAKSKLQVQYATNGFFASLGVIVVFVLVAGGLEFGGNALLLQPAGDFMGLSMLARDWVMVAVLVVLAAWIGGLGSLFRLYSLADPDKMAELETISLNESVTKEANNALATALEKARPVIATARAVAHVRAAYTDELKPEELEKLVDDVKSHLITHYATPATPAAPASVQVTPDTEWVVKEATTSLPLGEDDDEN